MTWLALILAFLLQSAPTSKPSAGPQAAAPVRPGPCPETNGRVTVEIVASADQSGSQAANRRLSQRRARAVAHALVSNGIPCPVIAERAVGEDEPQVMTPDGVPDPFNRYARIIFPVPPPRWAIVPHG